MKRYVMFVAVLLAVGCSSESGTDKDTTTGQDVSDVSGQDLHGDGTLPDGQDPDQLGDQIQDDVVEDTNPGDAGDTQIPDGIDPDVEDPDVVEDTDTGDVDVVDPEKETLCAELPELQGGTCQVTPGSAVTLIRGVILSPDGILRGGEVLVDADGLIACVGCNCKDHPDATGATEVVCPNGVVSPGLINAHDHITFTQNDPGNWGDERYEHRHDWRKGKRGHTKISVPGNASGDQIIWGEMRQVLGGTTSVAGSGSANGFLRNLDKSAQEGLNQPEVHYETFPLGDVDGELLASGCAYPGIDTKAVLENDCYFPHVAEGIDKEARNEFLCVSSDENGGVDLTEPNSTFVHVVGLKAMDGAEMAVSGTSMVWSPRSNVSLYGNTAPVTMYKHQGVLIALGTDWTASGSVNMLRELACANELNQVYYGKTFTDREVWLMGTANAAQALAIDDVVGSFKAGLVADIAIYAEGDAVNPYQAIFSANPGSVALVLRGGDPLYGDSEVMAALPGAQTGCEVMPTEICGSQKAVCTQREVGKSFSTLEGSNADAYDLFFCGVPAGEPTCKPIRPGEYTGDITASDPDGDNREGAQDNCPNVFNPIRPVDEGKQADVDDDGLGDLCDPCPQEANATNCQTPDPNDKDMDGVPNGQDNCPNDPNTDQKDVDGDLIGDVCDFCAEPNPGNSACPATIYDVKDGTLPINATALVRGVVTAVSGTRIFIQVPQNEQDPSLKAQYSGLFLFIPSANPEALTLPVLGDYVEVAGRVSDYFGQKQLDNITQLTKVSSGMALPAPILVAPSEVTTGSLLAAIYEGVLVQVIDAEVTDINPAAGPGDTAPTNEYVLDGLLRVNDYLYLTSPFPQIGDAMTITGILRFGNNNSKLEPRNEADIIRELALKEIGPGPVYVEEGAMNADTSPLLNVTLNAPAPAGGIVVALQSGAPERLAVPASVTVPEGQTQVAVKVDGLIGSVTAVVVSASYNGVTKTADVYVVPVGQNPKPISITPSPAYAVLGETVVVTMTLDIPAKTGGFVVTLDYDETIITGPTQAVFPAGTSQLELVFQGVGVGLTTIVGDGAGSFVSSEVWVVDLPQVGLVLSEVFYDPSGNDEGLEWVEIYNGTNDPIDLSNYSLGSGGASWIITVFQLSGTIPAGGCIVVGGPTSNASNFTPTFHQALDFNPDVQNSGDTADGVGLFNVKATSLTAGSIPIDAVLYGPVNTTGLKDETGSAGAVDVGDAISAQSVERKGTGWQIQATPTPNNCAAVLSL